jgi:hypothetical protein
MLRLKSELMQNRNFLNEHSFTKKDLILPFPFTLLIVCFRFLFSGTGAVESVLVGERGSGVERGFMPIGPGCSPSIGVSSSCECKLTESRIS